jgi:starch synthase
LLLHEFEEGTSALQSIAANVGNKGVILLLGSGDPQFEERLLQQVRDIPNVVFLRGYSEDLAAPLYHGGDLFLMPSSFEPCGISQMLAMRSGQPCVVHGVGGLKDTVEDDVTGFVFDGDSVREQATNFVRTTARAIKLRASDPIRWQQICKAAAARRFDWQAAARQTIHTLYGDDDEH